MAAKKPTRVEEILQTLTDLTLEEKQAAQAAYRWAPAAIEQAIRDAEAEIEFAQHTLRLCRAIQDFHALETAFAGLASVINPPLDEQPTPAEAATEVSAGV